MSNKIIRRVLNIILTCLIIITVIVAIFINSNTTFRELDNNIDFTEGWCIINENNERVDTKIPATLNNKTTLVNTLPEVYDNSSLIIQCEYDSIEAYVNNELIYESKPANLGYLDTEVGNFVSIIPLDSSYSNQEIVIKINDINFLYNNTGSHIKITTTSTYAFEKVIDNILNLILGSIFFLVAIICIIIWAYIIIYKKNIQSFSQASLVWLCILSTSLSVWILTEPHLISIHTGNFAMSGIINYIALMSSSVALLGLLKSLSKKTHFVLNWILSIAKTIFIVDLILFLTGILDLTYMFYFIHSCAILSIAIFVTYILMRKESFEFGKITTSFIILALPLYIIGIVSYLFKYNWAILIILSMAIILTCSLISIIVRIYKVIEEATQNIKYKEYALKDVMTGLGSRFAYVNLIEKYSSSQIPENLTLIFMDIDGLKTTNDNLGHSAGDEIIIATAECIKKAFEENGECFRMGGDEFLVVIDKEKEYIDKILAKFDNYVNNWQGDLVKQLKVSTGLVVAKEEKSKTMDDLLKKADHRMYSNKRQRKQQARQNAINENK